MPDISMCKGNNGKIMCPLREECYRFKAIPNEYAQTYFSVAPLKDDGICDYKMDYWPRNVNGKIIKN